MGVEPEATPLGVSETNAHVSLEEAPAAGAPVAASARPLQLVPWSGPGSSALRRRGEQLAEHLAAHPELPLADVAHTLGARGEHFERRLAAVCSSTAQLQEGLGRWLGGERSPVVVTGPDEPPPRAPRVALLFTGQGSQHVGMGRALYQAHPLFRATMDRCAVLFDRHLARPLLSVLYPPEGAVSPIDETAFTQPALFALQWSLYTLWRQWGLAPVALLGHSLGEVTAACAAGVLSLEDAVTLVAERSRRMGELPRGGAMASVEAPSGRVEALLEALAPPGVSIAAYNGPDQLVLSGAEEALATVVEQLRAEELKVTELRVSHAFHSARMDPMLEGFEHALGTLAFRAPQQTLISNVTGRAAGEEVASARYWAQHVRAPVRFAQGLEALLELEPDALVELGPEPVLLGMARRLGSDRSPALFLPSLRRGREDWSVLLRSVAQLYVHGADLDWEAFDAPFAPGLVDLPA